MPKVTYTGPSHRLEIDDKVLERDGEAVELTDEQVARLNIPGETFTIEQSTAPRNALQKPSDEGEAK